MAKANVQFGGGVISPKLNQHLQQANESYRPPAIATVEFGSGVISPKLKAHLHREATKTPAAKTQFGSGIIYPKLAQHLRD
jgi:hypothetical protein